MNYERLMHMGKIYEVPVFTDRDLPRGHVLLIASHVMRQDGIVRVIPNVNFLETDEAIKDFALEASEQGWSHEDMQVRMNITDLSFFRDYLLNRATSAYYAKNLPDRDFDHG